jgi:hypothetical protein
MQRAIHRWPLSNWFQPGPLTINLERGTPPCTSGLCDSLGYVDSAGQWWLWDGLSAVAPTEAFFFGVPGDIFFMGDWDGDGAATPGLYRQSEGYVYLRNTNTGGPADVSFLLGDFGDIPLVGDFDGDGSDTVSIYRPSEARVYLINELGNNGGKLAAAESSFVFGVPGDAPFVGDFNGDGIDTLGLFRPSTQAVFLSGALTNSVMEWSPFAGSQGDVIIAGDWDGDGDDTVAVYRPGEERVYVYLEHLANVAAYSVHIGSYHALTTWERRASETTNVASQWLSRSDIFTIAPN